MRDRFDGTSLTDCSIQNVVFLIQQQVQRVEALGTAAPDLRGALELLRKLMDLESALRAQSQLCLAVPEGALAAGR